MAANEQSLSGAQGPQRRGHASEWLTADQRAEVTDSSLARGIWYVAIHFVAYFASLALALAPLPLALNLVGAVANGATIGLLFLIGHDSGHSSFVPGPRWNRWITRLVFLPCLHSRSLWDVIHNRIHHGFTNLKGVERVWAPMSKEEFDNSSLWRRGLERFYRSLFGPLIYWSAEFWIPRLLLPLGREFSGDRRRHLAESFFVILVGGGMVAGIVIVGSLWAPDRPLWQIVLVGWVLPYLVWTYLISVSVLLQHTHPRIAWFDDPAEWNFYEACVRGGANVELPYNFLPLYRWIMVHPAHHALPSVPLYHIEKAEEALEKAYGNDVVSYRLSYSEFLRILRTCRLFDYRKKQWLDFDGTPTSDPIALASASGQAYRSKRDAVPTSSQPIAA